MEKRQKRNIKALHEHKDRAAHFFFTFRPVIQTWKKWKATMPIVYCIQIEPRCGTWYPCVSACVPASVLLWHSPGLIRSQAPTVNGHCGVQLAQDDLQAVAMAVEGDKFSPSCPLLATDRGKVACVVARLHARMHAHMCSYPACSLLNQPRMQWMRPDIYR